MSTTSLPRRPPGRAWVALCLAAAACAPPATEEAAPLLVVATIFPVADLAQRVAGDDARVVSLLPPRASIHTWEATPGQIRMVDRAAGYITVGGGLDGWLEELGRGRSGLRTLRLTEGLTLRRAVETDGHGHDGEAESGDPHVWLDPVLVRDDLLPRITELMVVLLPERERETRERAAALADSLTALDATIRTTLADAPHRSFLATHEAWGYFAERYALRSLGSLFEGPGHEPSARGLAALVDAAREAGVGAVLAEPQLAETAARALAGEVGARVVVVDPLGGPGLAGREGYLDLMRFNAQAFAQALRRP